VKSRLVEGVKTDAPGCRTQTGHARSGCVARIIGRGFDSPRVHQRKQNNALSGPEPAAGAGYAPKARSAGGGK